VSCHDQGTSVKQGCAGAPGGGSPGTLERANVAGVRESVVAVASQLIEMAAQPDDPAGGWPLPYRSQSRTRPAGTIVSRGISRASPSGCLRPQRPIVPVGGARGGPAERHGNAARACALRPGGGKLASDGLAREPGLVSLGEDENANPCPTGPWAWRRAQTPGPPAVPGWRLAAVSQLRPRRTLITVSALDLCAHSPAHWWYGLGAVPEGVVGGPPRCRGGGHPRLIGAPRPPAERTGHADAQPGAAERCRTRRRPGAVAPGECRRRAGY
jgi:hypothetical protein